MMRSVSTRPACAVGEHADVVAGGERLVHALQPFLRLGGEGGAHRQQQGEGRQRDPARRAAWLH